MVELLAQVSSELIVGGGTVGTGAVIIWIVRRYITRLMDQVERHIGIAGMEYHSDPKDPPTKQSNCILIHAAINDKLENIEMRLNVDHKEVMEALRK